MYHCYRIKWDETITCLDILNHSARTWASYQACPTSHPCVFWLPSAIIKGSVPRPPLASITYPKPLCKHRTQHPPCQYQEDTFQRLQHPHPQA